MWMESVQELMLGRGRQTVGRMIHGITRACGRRKKKKIDITETFIITVKTAIHKEVTASGIAVRVLRCM